MIWFVGILSTICLLLLGDIFYFIWSNRRICYYDAIELLKYKLQDTEVGQIINKLPQKYHRDYWINVIVINILKRIPNGSFTIKKLNEQWHSTIRRKIVVKYINKTLEEQKLIDEEKFKRNKKEKEESENRIDETGKTVSADDLVKDILKQLEGKND